MVPEQEVIFYTSKRSLNILKYKLNTLNSSVYRAKFRKQEKQIQKALAPAMFSTNGASQSAMAASRQMYPTNVAAATVATSTPRSAIESYWCPSYQVNEFKLCNSVYTV